MDVATLLASAGISAVVGSVVSLIAVSQTTVRRMRAERAELARKAVLAAVKPAMRAALMYQTGRKAGKRTNVAHLQDADDAAAVLAAADGLPGWRYRLVRRRVSRVYGRAYTDLAETFQTTEERFVSALFTSSSTSEDGEPSSAVLLDGLLHRAMCEDPDSRLVTNLRRELSLLSRCW